MAIEWADTKRLQVWDIGKDDFRDAEPADLRRAGCVPIAELTEATQSADKACDDRDAAVARAEKAERERDRMSPLVEAVGDLERYGWCGAGFDAVRDAYRALAIEPDDAEPEPEIDADQRVAEAIDAAARRAAAWLAARPSTLSDIESLRVAVRGRLR